jgi:phage-related protein
MTRLRFDWAESEGSQLEEEPRVSTTQFGDGYAQRAPDGINNMPRRWALQFRACGLAQGDEIVAFFRTHGGYKAFDWTPPRETVTAAWVCKSWRRSLPNALGESDISATFEEDFAL